MLKLIKNLPAHKIPYALCAPTGSNFSQPVSVAIGSNVAYITNAGSDSLTKCSLLVDGSLTDCRNTATPNVRVMRPDGLALIDNHLIIASEGNNSVVTCTFDLATGLITWCSYAQYVEPSTYFYHSVAVKNGMVYLTGIGSTYSNIGSCTYNRSSGTIGYCLFTILVSVDSSYSGVSVYNNVIYASTFQNSVEWCPLDADGRINDNVFSGKCAARSGFIGARGMAVN